MREGVRIDPAALQEVRHQGLRAHLREVLDEDVREHRIVAVRLSGQLLEASPLRPAEVLLLGQRGTELQREAR